MIDYAKIVNDCNLLAILRILEDVKKIGNTGFSSEESAPHITFLTRSPDLGLPKKIKAQYPEVITIALQHKFYDMDIDYNERVVSVTVIFSGNPAHLRIPFGDIVAYYDLGTAFMKDGRPVFAVRHIPEELPVETQSEEHVVSPKIVATEGNVTKVKFGK